MPPNTGREKIQMSLTPMRTLPIPLLVHSLATFYSRNVQVMPYLALQNQTTLYGNKASTTGKGYPKLSGKTAKPDNTGERTYSKQKAVDNTSRNILRVTW